MSPWLRARLHLDRAVAAILLVGVSPVLGVAALAVRRDGGPAFVAVPRVGRGGTTFRMWKVRTMRADGTGGVALGPGLALGEGDPRVTTVGRRIRRWRIDELANLVNVLKGEMALIGGRPEAPDYVDLGDSRWATILLAPPALVGPSQILVEAWEAELLGREGPDAYRAQVLPVKLAIDEWYVTRSTWRVDLAIVGGLIGWLTGLAPSGARLRAILARDLGSLPDGLPAG